MKSLQGHLLVASPQLRDPNFCRSVILLVQHDENGAMGLVLNRPTETTLAEAWKQVSEEPCGNEDVLLQGGPCEGPLMVLHAEESAGQIEVAPGLYFSTEAQSVEWLVRNESEPAKYFVGYAGWSAEQLEMELGENAWQAIPATAEQVFEGPADMWGTLARVIARSRTYPQVSPKITPADPSLN